MEMRGVTGRSRDSFSSFACAMHPRPGHPDEPAITRSGSAQRTAFRSLFIELSDRLPFVRGPSSLFWPPGGRLMPKAMSFPSVLRKSAKRVSVVAIGQCCLICNFGAHITCGGRSVERLCKRPSSRCWTPSRLPSHNSIGGSHETVNSYHGARVCVTCVQCRSSACCPADD